MVANRRLEIGDSSLTASLDRLAFVNVAVLKAVVALQLFRGLWRDDRLTETYLLLVLWATLVSMDSSVGFLRSVVLIEVDCRFKDFLVNFV